MLAEDCAPLIRDQLILRASAGHEFNPLNVFCDIPIFVLVGAGKFQRTYLYSDKNFNELKT